MKLGGRLNEYGLVLVSPDWVGRLIAAARCV